MLVAADGLHGLGKRKVEFAHYLIYNKKKGREHARGLERVGPDKRLDAATTGVEPDEHRHSHHREGEDKFGGTGHNGREHLRDDEADHVEPDGGSRHLRQQKERSPRLVGPLSEPSLQKRVDGREVPLVIDGQQEESYGHIAENEAQAGLHVGHVGVQNHAGDADKRDAGDAGTYHSEGHHVPRTAAVCPVEGFVAGPFCRESAEHHQHAKVGKNRQNNHHNGCKITLSLREKAFS